jgi:hypothetical protein
MDGGDLYRQLGGSRGQTGEKHFPYIIFYFSFFIGKTEPPRHLNRQAAKERRERQEEK